MKSSRLAKNWKVFCLLSLAIWASCVHLVNAAPLQVTVVLSEDSPAYQAFSQALHEQLHDKNISLSTAALTAPLPSEGLSIGVGMKAATALAASNAPAILNVLIPKSGHDKLLRDGHPRAAQFSSIFIEQPTDRQIHFAVAALPAKSRIGVLFDANQALDVAGLKREVKQHNHSLVMQEVSADMPLAEALQALLQHSDALLALPNPAIYNANTLRNILLTTYRAGIPLVGFSPSYVKAGALCAVFSSPEHIATQAAQWIRNFATSHTLPAAQYPQLFDVAVNEQVARSLSIAMPSSDELRLALRALMGDTP
jgi:putative tryptophan/tyrosine transport system substrate-binding protein